MEHNFRKTMFHDDIKYVITVGQFFGILPITNVLNTSEKISFSWYSKTIIYCYVIIAGTIFMCIMSFIKLTEDRFSIHGFGKASMMKNKIVNINVVFR